MTESLRIGILGCGVITQRTLPGLKAILMTRDAKITAICDLSDANLAAVEAEYGQGALGRFDSLDAMLRDGRINTLLVATPISMHYDNVKAGLSAGCHVYTHKTLAATPERCLELGSLANNNGLRLAASPGQVLLPAYRRAREIIESGELGEIVSIDAAAEAAAHRWEAERADENPAKGRPFSWEWYHQEQQGGGPLDDMFVYPLAFLTETFGEVNAAAVHCRLVAETIDWKGRTIAADTPDSYSGFVRFGDVASTIRSSFGSNSSRVPWGFVSMRGTDAGLEIEKVNDREYRLYVTPNGGDARAEQLNVFSDEEATLFGSAECHVLTDINELLEAALGDREVIGATAKNAARVAKGLALIKDSAASGGKLVNSN